MSTPAKNPVEPPSPLHPRTILVPVDFSPRASKALDYGLAFARQFGARLVVLHVVEVPYIGADMGGTIDVLPLESELSRISTEQLDKLVKERIADTVAATSVIRTGQPWWEIADAAREHGADLLVLGTHGYTGLKHVLLGSTAERVVRHAPCPVLVVREQEKDCAETTTPKPA